jgi:hypothetical protein
MIVLRKSIRTLYSTQDTGRATKIKYQLRTGEMSGQILVFREFDYKYYIHRTNDCERNIGISILVPVSHTGTCTPLIPVLVTWCRIVL